MAYTQLDNPVFKSSCGYYITPPLTIAGAGLFSE